MEFIKQGFIILCKEAEEYDGYFAEEEGELTYNIEKAHVFFNEDVTRKFINSYDKPEDFTYKPVEITYIVKNLRLA